MSSIPEPSRPTRRFTQRLLAVMLAAGLLPAIVWGLATSFALRGFLGISLAPLERLLERSDEELLLWQSDSGLARDTREARLYLAQAEVARRALVRRMPFVFALFALSSAAFSFFAAIVMGHRLSRPIDQLTGGVMRYAEGDFLHQIPEQASGAIDELQFLVRQFNRMGKQLENQRQRLQLTEKLAAWQGVARAMAHELTAMKMALLPRVWAKLRAGWPLDRLVKRPRLRAQSSRTAC